MDDFKVMAGAFFACIALAAGLVLGCLRVAHHFDGAQCLAFARESGRVVKFVDYNALSWDCLTPQKDGKWISAYQLRGVSDS